MKCPECGTYRESLLTCWRADPSMGCRRLGESTGEARPGKAGTMDQRLLKLVQRARKRSHIRRFYG